jgi:predicted DNA binding CopG/RHH family protein
MKKRLPKLKSDAEAEAFVAKADLTEYDLSDMTLVKFELRRKDTSVSLRLPKALLDEIRGRARRAGIPYQRFIRLAIERALASERK